MRLTLSSESVRNAVFTNEAGQVLYKASHPLKLGAGTTTVHKVVPNVDPADMRDQFRVVGEIEWSFVGSSTFRLNGEEMRSNDFLPSRGITGRKRTFVGQGNRPFKWDLFFMVVALSRDDGSKMEVARYHRSSLGIVGPKTKSYLDVDPSVTDMLDLIILTFIYVEKLRMDRERAAEWRLPTL